MSLTTPWRPFPGDGRPPRAVALLAVALAAASACTPPEVHSISESDGGSAPRADAAARDAPGAVPAARNLIDLAVSPFNDVVLVDRGKTESRAFKVLARYSDGSSEDVTAKATLVADNAAAGAFTGPMFQTTAMTNNQIAFSRIVARYEVNGATVMGEATLTVVWLRLTGAAQDFFFTLPYEMAPAAMPQTKELSFRTFIQSLDVFFAVDTTASMTGPITGLRDSLENTIIPGVKAAAARDAWFGVGAIEDFGYEPYGQPADGPMGVDDQPFILISPMSMDVPTAQASVGNLLVGGRAPRGDGGDGPEGQMEALYQIATGAGNVVKGIVNVPPHAGKGKGGVEFREGAQPVVVVITDAPFHTKGESSNPGSPPGRGDRACNIDYMTPVAELAHTRTETADALNKICAKVIGIGVGSTPGVVACPPLRDLDGFAQTTGALVPPEAWDAGARPAGCAVGQCCTGQGGVGEATNQQGLCPLVFKTNATARNVGAQITSGITQLARYSSFDVVASTAGVGQGTAGEMVPTGKTTADFIKSVSPLGFDLPPAPPVIKAPTIDAGTNTFKGVFPGAVLRFTISAKNDFLPALPMPQIFHATIRIRAGGCADLDERDVIILVPPKPLIE